jgi:ribosomal protein L3
VRIYKTKWWKKVFKRKPEPKGDAVKDIKSVIETLSEVENDVKPLLKTLEKLKELEKERNVAKSGIVQVNIETQTKLMDELLERYEFFQNDIDINGLRIKRTAKSLLGHARHHGLKDVVAEKKKDMKWQFDW